MSLVFTFKDSHPTFTTSPLVIQRRLCSDLPMSLFHRQPQYYLIQSVSFETSEYFVVHISRPSDSRGFESFEMTMSKRPSSEWVKLTISDDKCGFFQNYWYEFSSINSEGIEWSQKQNTLEIKIPKSSTRQEIISKRREAKQKKSERKQAKKRAEKKSALVTPPERVEVAMKECEGLLALSVVSEQLENDEEHVKGLEQAENEQVEFTEQAEKKQVKTFEQAENEILDAHKQAENEQKDATQQDENKAQATEQSEDYKAEATRQTDRELAEAAEGFEEVKSPHYSESEEELAKLANEPEDTSNLKAVLDPSTEEEQSATMSTQETDSETDADSGTEKQGFNVDTEEDPATGEEFAIDINDLQGKSSPLSTDAEAVPKSAELEEGNSSDIAIASQATSDDNDDWVDVDPEVTPIH